MIFEATAAGPHVIGMDGTRYRHFITDDGAVYLELREEDVLAQLGDPDRVRLVVEVVEP